MVVISYKFVYRLHLVGGRVGERGRRETDLRVASIENAVEALQECKAVCEMRSVMKGCIVD